MEVAISSIFENIVGYSCFYNFTLVMQFFADLWMQWVRDEQSVSTTQEEKMRVKELLERAVKEYTCECNEIIFNNNNNTILFSKKNIYTSQR